MQVSLSKIDGRYVVGAFMSDGSSLFHEANKTFSLVDEAYAYALHIGSGMNMPVVLDESVMREVVEYAHR